MPKMMHEGVKMSCKEVTIELCIVVGLVVEPIKTIEKL